MKKIKEVIVVEGRYDQNTLSQVVDATVIPLGGFAIFNDREKLAFLRRLAEERGLILLTDSDGAGFVIRNYLKGALPKDREKALDWLRRAVEAGGTGAAEDLRALEADADAPQARKKGLLGRLFGS